MKIKLNQSFHRANLFQCDQWERDLCDLVSTGPQPCVPATDQPEWETDCKVYVKSISNREILLTKDDYRVVITEESEEGHYNQPYEKKAVLLKVGQQLIPYRIVGDKMLCETLPKGDALASRHQYAWRQFRTDVEIHLSDLFC